MSNNILKEMGSQVALTKEQISKNKAREKATQKDQSVVNPSFEPDDITPQCLSPVKSDTATRDIVHDIFLVNMNDTNAQDDGSYEPHDNRIVTHPTTNFETFIHLLKSSLGTGILAMPRAFANAGYILGIISTIFIGLLCTYCVHMLIDSCYVLCKRRKVPSMSYTAAAEAALYEGPDWCKACAPYAKHVVNVFLLVYQMGTCCVYVVFVSENIHTVLVNQFKLEGITVTDVMLWILLPLILINWCRDLKYLAPFSAIANVVTIVSFGIILYYIFRETPKIEDKLPIGRLADYPLFLGTVLFALEAIGVILPLENEMKTPRHFVGKFGVLNKAMAIIVTLYVGMGLFGYLQYGDATEGSITLNLGKAEILASVVQCLLAFAIYITHGLACYVAIDILWNEYIGIRLKGRNCLKLWEYLLRTTVVVITFGVAAAVPELDLFISLFGALCLSALGLVFPALIQTVTYWNFISGRQRKLMVFKNSLVVIFGVLGLVVGTWTSLSGIIAKFSIETTATP